VNGNTVSRSTVWKSPAARIDEKPRVFAGTVFATALSASPILKAAIAVSWGSRIDEAS
jgi:hypothetical protein